MFIVEFSNIPFSAIGSIKNYFQIILYEGSNHILVNYLDVTSRGSGNTTAGIENLNGTTGLQYSRMDTPGRYTNRYVRYVPPSENGTRALYFPHVDSGGNTWETEIGVINKSEQELNGIFKAYNDNGESVSSNIAVTLPPKGRREITIGNEFMNPGDIGYIIFESDSESLAGYTKFYQEGVYRAAIPAVKVVNASDIYISHIDSIAYWWTGISLVNTTSAAKELTITFNDGRSVAYTLNANEHKAFTIDSLFNDQPQPDIKSAVITNASGIIGLEIFGSAGSDNQLDGLLLTDNTASTIYYPHVASDALWWTGIVAYNPSDSACTITITPYSAQGTPLLVSTLPLAGKGKYIGLVSNLGLPAQTAWFKIDSTRPLTGFELFSTVDGDQLAAYAEKSGAGAKEGVFAKIEKSGWTGIAFVNIENAPADVTMTAYNDTGSVIATQTLNISSYEKVVGMAPYLFSQDISAATYIGYSSDKNLVGFQINASSDNMMLDALPGM
ncbi:MAG: hypothetical protein AUK24_00030 [Syntrophaceae bacterium CG2_30_49_12]|nr:MAG: hypothetical protein AUK24_00030 [Syntrophaceae bacterium CG2_30_49_12]